MGSYILQRIASIYTNCFFNESKVVSRPSLGACFTAEWEGMLDTSEEYTSQLALIRPKTTLEVRALGHMLSALDLCPELFSVTLHHTVLLKGS